MTCRDCGRTLPERSLSAYCDGWCAIRYQDRNHWVGARQAGWEATISGQRVA